MENGITISREGKNYGPYTESQLLELIASAHASPDDHAWREGMADWQPLRVVMPSCAAVPPPAPVSARDEVYLQEEGVYVSKSQIQLGGNLFVPGNVGGVSLQREDRRIALPMTGMILFGLWALGCLIGALTSKDHEQASSFIGLIIFIPLAVWCARRVFAPRKITLQIAASGGMQTGLIGTDSEKMNRIAAAIQKAILLVVFLIAITSQGALSAQETTEGQELHLLVVKVQKEGVLADRLEPHENATARHLKVTGSPLASGMIPANVSREGLGEALEPVWRPSGVLVFVKGSFPGIAEGDRKTVTAARTGSCTIRSKKDGDSHTIALYQMQ